MVHPNVQGTRACTSSCAPWPLHAFPRLMTAHTTCCDYISTVGFSFQPPPCSNVTQHPINHPFRRSLSIALSNHCCACLSQPTLPVPRPPLLPPLRTTAITLNTHTHAHTSAHSASSPQTHAPIYNIPALCCAPFLHETLHGPCPVPLPVPVLRLRIVTPSPRCLHPAAWPLRLAPGPDLP